MSETPRTVIPPTLNYGSNLFDLTYYYPGWIFNNIALQRSETRNWGYGPKTLIFRAISNGYPTGIYQHNGMVTSAEGDAEVISDGIEVVNATPEGIILNGDFEDKKLKIWLPNSDHELTFTDDFLSLFEDAQCLRFMDWFKINHSTQTTLNYDIHGRQTSDRGVALQYAIELCNILKKDMYICVPHMVTGDALRVICLIINTLLDPSLNLYIELSNEVWNSSFGQSQYFRDLGVRFLPDPIDNYQKQLKAYALKSSWVHAVCRLHLNRNFFSVLGSQAYSLGVSDAVLRYYEGKPDFLAIAPYFGTLITDHSNPETVLELCEADIHDRVLTAIKDQYLFASQNGVELLAYEGGQHTKSVEANQSSEMRRLYEEYLNIWQRETNNSLFLHYARISNWNNQSGCWGRRPHILSGDKF